MQVSLYLRVRFAECDSQNVVFNARYADYVDLASTEFMRFLCGGYEQLVERGFSSQVVNLNIDWFASAVFDDVLTLEMECTKIGTTSFALTCIIKRHKDGLKIANARSVYVVLDDATGTKTPIPDDIRKKLTGNEVYGPINFAGEIDPLV